MSEQPTNAPEATASAAGHDPAPAAPERSEQESVEHWRNMAREQERRAKANADAAKRLAELEDRDKSEQQRAADARAAAERERDDARAESLRYKAAATHKIGPDYFDLLGNGTEDEITARAERLGTLLAKDAEIDRLTTELDAARLGRNAPTTARPTAALRPGASPSEAPSEDDSNYAALFGNG